MWLQRGRSVLQPHPSTAHGILHPLFCIPCAARALHNVPHFSQWQYQRNPVAAILGVPLREVMRGYTKRGAARASDSDLCFEWEFRTMASSGRPGPRLAGRKRPSPAFTEKKGKGEGKSRSRPLTYTLQSLHPSSPTLLTSPSHIRSSDWPIKYRKYVSTDECSAQAENGQCEADYSSSSITRIQLTSLSQRVQPGPIPISTSGTSCIISMHG